MADDRCLQPGGCQVYPNYVIDRSQGTRFSTAQLRDGSQLIPGGSQVDRIDDAYVDVVSGYIDDKNTWSFNPRGDKGGIRFIHIRFCYPPGPPNNGRCVEGWIRSSDLVAVEYEAEKARLAAFDKANKFAFSDIWDTVKNVVTDDTFWAILGSFVTAGSAGWLTGILTTAEQTALQEGMKGLSAIVIPAASCLGGALYADANSEEYKRCLQVAVDTNFFDAWKGQLVWRMKRAVELGGPGVAAQLSTTVTALANSLPYAKQVKTAYETVRGAYLSGKKVYDSVEKEKAAFLAKLEEACKQAGSTFTGGECRPDALALAANHHLGENYFDPSDWNVTTGRPITIADFLPQTTAALRIPDLEKAFKAATMEGHPTGIPRAVVLQLSRMLFKAYEGRQKLLDLGIKPNPDATTIFTKIKLHKDATGEFTAAPPPPEPETGSVVLTQLFKASVYTFPVWGGFLLGTWLRKRQKKGTRRR